MVEHLHPDRRRRTAAGISISSPRATGTTCAAVAVDRDRARPPPPAIASIAARPVEGRRDRVGVEVGQSGHGVVFIPSLHARRIAPADRSHRLPHRRRAVPDRDRRSARYRGRDRARATRVRPAVARVDAVRQLLVNEPRGHADMYGGFVVAARRRRRPLRRAVLAQGRLFDRVRARHDRAGRVGRAIRSGRGRPPTATPTS